MKLVVIGGGPGGYEAALYAAKRGAQVVLVEKDTVGGTCLNRGCIPTKALLAASDVLQTVRKAKDFGVQAENVRADYAAAVARKNRVVAGLVKGVEFLLKTGEVTLLHGAGRILDANTVVVTLQTGGEEEIACDAILLATGSVPARPGFLQVDGEHIISSDELLNMSEAPTSIIIVGGGVIGCEIGQFLARMGTGVTIVEAMAHLLPLEDEDTAMVLQKQFRKEKIKMLCGKGITAVEQLPDGVKATLEDGTALQAQKLLVAVGRRPYTQGLGLDAAGIQPNKKGCVPVDAAMYTGVGRIYAIGDIVDSLQLAHVATKEGCVAVDNMLGKTSQMRYDAVPRCVYTSPEVAAVGYTEAQLCESGRPYAVGKFDFFNNGKAKAAGKTEGFAKVLVDGQGVVVGAALVGAHTTEMMQVWTLAVDLKLTAAQVAEGIFPHPTMSEAMMEALRDAQDKPAELHVVQD